MKKVKTLFLVLVMLTVTLTGVFMLSSNLEADVTIISKGKGWAKSHPDGTVDYGCDCTTEDECKIVIHQGV